MVEIYLRKSRVRGILRENIPVQNGSTPDPSPGQENVVGGGGEGENCGQTGNGRSVNAACPFCVSYGSEMLTFIALRVGELYCDLSIHFLQMKACTGDGMRPDIYRVRRRTLLVFSAQRSNAFTSVA